MFSARDLCAVSGERVGPIEVQLYVHAAMKNQASPELLSMAQRSILSCVHAPCASEPKKHAQRCKPIPRDRQCEATHRSCRAVLSRQCCSIALRAPTAAHAQHSRCVVSTSTSSPRSPRVRPRARRRVDPDRRARQRRRRGPQPANRRRRAGRRGRATPRRSSWSGRRRSIGRPASSPRY